MFKLMLVLFGAAAGAAGTTAWLLSEPETPAASPIPIDPESFQARWQDLNTRVREAVTEGKQAGQETEARLRLELDTYRRGGRPAST